MSSNKVTLKRVRPNALLEDWIANMYEEAKSKKNKLEPMLKEALDSLSKYPVKIRSGTECMILKGFDKALCKYLDHCLARYNSNLALSHYCDSRYDEREIRPDSPTSKSTCNNNNIPQSNNSTPTFSSSSEADSASQSSNTPVNFLPKDPSIRTEEPPISSKNKEISPISKSKGKKTTKPAAKNKYKPAHRSGGYAILIALLEHSSLNKENPSLTKEALIEIAQIHSEESFVRPKPDSFYTAWSNMNKLITKGLVKKIKKKQFEYFLTEEGKKVATEILEEGKIIPSANDIIFNNVASTGTTPEKQNDNIGSDEVPTTSRNVDMADEVSAASQNINNNIIEMPPSSFDIILLIDKNETGGVKKKNDPTVAQFNKYADLKHEYRSLKVGDFTWIARSHANPDQELVLPYVVERKRMDDLGASIKDGRFHEQKFRLRKCGLDNVIYMVENYGKNKHVGLPIQSLMQALANTRVQDGFKVHETDSLANSVRFLAMMTKRLTIRYQDKHLRGHADDPRDGFLMTFEYFNKSSAKTKALTVTETFIKLLLQLKGVSVEKALAITKKYPTPRSLINAYVKCDRKECEILLAHLRYNEMSRNVGPIVSKTIYQLFNSGGVL